METFIQIFFIVFELALIVIGILLCREWRKIYREWKDIKKQYCLAHKEIKPGHTHEPTRAEIKPQLRAKQIELAGWLVVIFCDLYACVDRLIWILN